MAIDGQRLPADVRNSLGLMGTASAPSWPGLRRDQFVERNCSRPITYPLSAIAKPFLPPSAGYVLIPQKNSTFPFQTTSPRSCCMRPPGGILCRGESLIATVFKFVEPPENNAKVIHHSNRVKFKIMSLEMKGEIHYVPELTLEKLKGCLAEATAEFEACQKSPEVAGQKSVGSEGLIMDEWRERRETYLAQEQHEGLGSA